MPLPSPQKSSIQFMKQGVRHTSPYVGSVLATVTFNSRPLIRAIYDYHTADLETTNELQNFLFDVGNGRAEIPLFLNVRSGQGHFESTKVNILSNINQNQISLLHNPTQLTSIPNGFDLEKGDYLQFGRYCLKILAIVKSAQGSNTLYQLTIGNMPEGLNTLPDDTPIKYGYDNYHMLGVNINFNVAYEQVNSELYRPGTIEFWEIS